MPLAVADTLIVAVLLKFTLAFDRIIVPLAKIATLFAAEFALA